MVSSRLATLHELETVYSVEDLHDMLEVLAVDAHNKRVVIAEQQRQERDD